jgi:hypothetical protein
MISTTTAICRRQLIANQFTGGIAIAFLAIAAVFVAPRVQATEISGALFTTDSSCTGVDLNIYGQKSDVYINGGPSHPGAAGLPDGYYCVRVTDPSGATILGQSVEGAVHVTNGEFDKCYQLTDILYSASSNYIAKGYDDTPNNGGEYKVWISPDCTFTNSFNKTDNFKVKEGGGGPGGQASICVKKFYDANANGVQDDGEPNLSGWEYCVVGNNNFSALRFTFDPPRCLIVDPDDYCVTEGTPVEGNWVHTTDTQACFTLDTVTNPSQDVTFGNVCLGAGGGLTLGFWSNQNGEALMTGTKTGNTLKAADQNLLRSLCLRNANGTYLYTGTNVAPTTQNITYTTFRNWILAATATNMANMLSAQLAAMELNVLHGKVNGGSLVFAGACGNTGAGGQFITVNDLMAAAQAQLCADGYTPAGDPNRATQECLKNALDAANNNTNFVESSPCPFSFNVSDSCPFTNP